MKKPPQVALIIESSVSYGRSILQGIARYMSSHHRWSVYFEQHELGTPPPAWLASSHWDGILCRPTDPALARRLKHMKVPTVDLNDLHDGLKLPWVGSNHHTIGRLGASHFVERGFRNFAFCGFSNELWAAQRRDGFRSTVEKEKQPIPVYESSWRGSNVSRWDLEIKHIGKWLAGLPKPVGVMACNDARALHVLDACQQADILVPEEVAVVGVDNEEIFCELCNPALSSVAPDAERIGYQAAELLDQLMSGQSPPCRRILIDPIRVVTRRSSDTLAIKDRTVAAAIRYISDQALHGCTVADVVKFVRASRSFLERKFRQHLKRSPQAEIRRIQADRIKQLLTETDYTLERISELSGFEHPEYMSVVFKRLFDQTPGQYRKQMRANIQNSALPVPLQLPRNLLARGRPKSGQAG
ncbi:MAG TPA: DNA-binding transcriptional regulator [Verrucomicrobiae bacterium]|nr:DNA-binding transcriptional regulator [Verrucomicrobiae bacterium]